MSQTTGIPSDIKALAERLADASQRPPLKDKIKSGRQVSLWRILYPKDGQGYETRYSRFLSWLLDPTESHGLGDAFLRVFLEGVRDEEALAPADGRLPVQRSAGASGSRTEALRNIDIVAWDAPSKTVVAVEVKQHTGEHASTGYASQLEKYHDAILQDARFGSSDFENRYFIYLTITGESVAERHGDAPWVKAWNTMSYADLISRLGRLLTDPEINLEIRQVIVDFQRELQRTLDFVSDDAAALKETFLPWEDLIEEIVTHDSSADDQGDTASLEAREKKDALVRAAGELGLLPADVDSIVDFLHGVLAAQTQDKTPHSGVQAAIQQIFCHFAGITVATGEAGPGPKDVADLQPTIEGAQGLAITKVYRTQNKGQGLNFFVVDRLTGDEVARIYISGDSAGNIPNDGFGVLGRKEISKPIKNKTLRAEHLGDEARIEKFTEEMREAMKIMLHELELSRRVEDETRHSG